ncbi:MAG: ADP-glyceromanno-heptose 6-epimerase [Rhodospirillaceae bacterium]
MIIVTGAAGFIGSNVLEGLERAGYDDVVAVDRLRDGTKWRNLAKRGLRDIIRPEDLMAYLESNKRPGDVQAILHLGAISATTERDVDRILENNIRLTLDLWHWAAVNDVTFLYASSAATYGDGAEGFADGWDPAHLARFRPLNAYGWSKHMTDRRIADDLSKARPTPKRWAGFKFFNVYGPNEFHKGPQSSVVSQVHPIAKAGESFPLFRSHHPDYADGGQLRDFVWVGDVVDILLWFLAQPAAAFPSDLYNVGTGQARSFLDLATGVYRALGLNAQISWRDTPEAIRDKYQYFTQAEMGRLRKAGYDKAFTSLEDGIAQYVAVLERNDDPFL